MNSSGISIPIKNSIPPLPIMPLGPFSMNRPVIVITSRHTAKGANNKVAKM